MARTVYRSSIKYPVKQTYEIISRILNSRRYSPYNYNGDYVWKEGVGLATAMHYIKISFVDDNTIQISGWIQAGIGKLGLSEQSLAGKMGIIPKVQVQDVIAEILGNISADPRIVANPKDYVKKNSGGFFTDLPPYKLEEAISASAQNTIQAAPPTNTGQEKYQFCQKCGNKIIIPASHSQSFIFCGKCGTKADIL